MTTVREPWITLSALPRTSSYEDMLSFFGIPPYTPDRLDDNIAKKRRDWYAKTSSGNPRGRQKAKEVVTLIQRVSEALKRGTQVDVGGGAAAEIPDSVFQTLEELWRIISEYVFGDDYDRALQVAREAASRWGMTPDAASVLAWVVATGFDSGNLAHPSLLREGCDAAEIAVRGQPGEARNWESKVSLLLALSRVPDAATTTDEAARVLGAGLTPRLHMLRARTMISMNRGEDATVAAVRAVQLAASDPGLLTAVRSQATGLLVDWLARNLLPLKSAADYQRYMEMVDAAAWCSHGVPEAEDMVRVHRMWATNAGQRVFIGSWKLRSFFAVCTGFISLPIHNWMRSAPAWQVFIKGMQGLQQQQPLTESFIIVAGPQYVQRAHGLRLPFGLDDL